MADDARHDYVLHMVWLLADIALHEETVSWAVGMLVESPGEEMIDSEISVTRAKSVQPR